MPSISKIRLTNVIYENGAKRYNDMIFNFDGHNGAFLLENGGGKTVFIQTVLQAVIPHIDMADRKIKDTLSLDGNPAHIAVEWILNEEPRRYGLTATSLYIENSELKSIKYTYEYNGEDPDSIEEVPFVVKTKKGEVRGASRGEINEYYERMKTKSMHAKTFRTIIEYGKYIEEQFKIIPNEWRKIATINSGEGNVDEFFNRCKTTQQLLDYLLIPTVEEAIEGEHKQNFVDIFEKQRQHFKINKRLLDEIEQFQQVKDHIDAYVFEYKGLHDAHRGYEQKQYQMYRLYRFLENAYQKNIKKKESLKREEIALEQEEKQLKHEEASLEVRQKEQIIDSLSQTIKVYNEEYNQICQQYDALAARKQNIEMSSLQKRILQINERLAQLDRQLETLDETLEIDDIKERLEINSQKIHGRYRKMFEQIDDEIRLNEMELERETEQTNLLEKTKRQQEHQRQQLANRLGKLQGSIDALIHQMDDIECNVLTNPEVESLVSEYMQWNERLQRNEMQKRQEQKELKKLLLQQTEKENQLDRTRENLSQLKEKRLNIEYSLSRFEKEQEALILAIESRSHSLYISDSIYSKEESIIKRLTEKRMHMESKYEEAMQTERLHKNLSDMYSEHERFIVEPLVGKIVYELKDRVSFIEQGVYYLDTLADLYQLSNDALYERFPLWAMTIVTTDSDMATVKQVVENYGDQLTYPILIVSKDKIGNLLEEEQISIPYNIGYEVFPKQWKSNLSPDNFKQWKEKNIQIGQEHETKRKEFNKQVQMMRDLEQRALEFFENYSYKQYMDFKDTLQKIHSELASQEEQFQEVKKELELQGKQIEHLRYSLDALTQEHFELSSKIQQANTYIQLVKQKDAQEMLLEKSSSEEALLNKEYDKSTVQIPYQVEIVDRLEQKIQDLKTRMHVLSQQELYKETLHTEPIYESIDLNALEDERKMLEGELRGIHLDRSTLIDRRKEIQTQYTEIQAQLQLKKEEAKYPIEQIEVYAENEISGLIQKIKQMEKQLDLCRRKIQAEYDEKNRYKALHDDQEQKIIHEHQYIWTFEEGLDQAKTRIASTWKEWRNHVRQVKNELEKVDIYLQEDNHLIQELNVKNARYSFLVFDEKYRAEDIESEDVGLLDDEAVKKERVAKWIYALEKAYDMYIDKKKYIEEERNKYIHYCQTHIRDFKLKEAAINGVKRKNNYQDLMDYQKQMTKIIERNIRIAEEDRRQSDLELQTFLTHLITYVQQVVIELDSIQKKTRINVDDISKQIFIFDIPEWNEFEAKEELRKYIEVLVEEYDRQSDLDNPEEEKLRDQLEQKLSVNNLLSIVLKDRSIKIKCRKVTNDMKINKAPMVWESSNKWSGGEKWSKNMTLFLGILNYLAEKKQYLTHSQKSQRTVILDNPFGKASSKHVLDPVFFIAEKLGFQIIALTAHAEGKFISDYFPVVYSGRLRQTHFSDKQVMTNEKFVNYAYLHEKSPRSIMRMEEKEQLSFFE